MALHPSLRVCSVLAVSASLGVGGALAPGVVLAAEPPADSEGEEPADEPETEDPLAEAKSLYAEGTGKYATADYEGAIELWTRAYTLVPSTVEYREIKADLMWDIATAREKSFDVDGEVSHLKQAEILLNNYLADLASIMADEDALATERKRVEERLEAIRAKMAEASGGPQPGPGANPEPRPAEELPSGRTLLIAGGVLAGVGVVGLGVGGAGMAIGSGANDISELDPNDIDGRREQFDRGRLGNGLAIGGGIAGGVFLVTGVALLAVGAKREKARKGMALLPTPTFGRDQVGVGLAGRF